jgi:hypothetical protein
MGANMTITLTREEAQQVLDALDNILDKLSEDCCDEYSLWEQYQIAADVADDIRVRLAQRDFAPPQREWQRLTDEEIKQARDIVDGEYKMPNAWARAIESKLKEKNT